RCQHPLARVRPVLVAAKCVDLAVVDEIAIRMRTSPARKCIGAETGVNNRNGGFHRWIRKIRIESDHLSGCQHPLIDKRPAGETWNVKEIPTGEPGIANRIFCPAPNDVKLALKCQVVLDVFASTDEYLPDERLVGFGRLAQIQIIRGPLAPAAKKLPLAAYDCFQNLFKLPPLIAMVR